MDTQALIRVVALLGLAVGDPSPLAVIGPAPETRLIDARGRPFDLESLRGKCALVSFVYTTCNGTCPLTSAAMAKCRDALAKEGLWGEKVEFVSVTLDPAHDTPEALTLYSGIYDADPKTWHFLTGSDEQVGRVMRAWGMWARRDRTGALDHPSRIFLIDPKGRQREIYSLEFLDPEAVAKDVRGLLAE
jgi:protein SCO1/2